MVLPQDFKEFLRLLNSKQVEYLLVGGYAVGHYGYIRATADIDFFVAVSPENAKKLVEVVKLFGFDLPDLKEELFQKSNKVIRMGNPPFRLEIITSASGVDFSDCFKRKIKAMIDGVETNIISLEDLKKNKKAAGRAQDIADLEHLPKG